MTRCPRHRFPEPCLLCRWEASGTPAERAEALRVAEGRAPEPAPAPAKSDAPPEIRQAPGFETCRARYKLVPD